jgi:FhaA, N-terminal domain/FHA domain
MGPLAALERFFERLFERPSARLFGARLQPVQLLRRVERAMETARLTTSDAVLVPEHVVVRLHPDDLATFGGEANDLAAELADGALRFARAHGYRLRGRPRVDLVADAAVGAGDPVAAARFEPIAAERSSSASTTHPPVGAPAPDAFGEDRTVQFAAPGAIAPLARLRVLEPHGADRSFVLHAGVLTIGRGSENDLVLGDPRVSRRHARIQVRGGRLVLSDLDSRNGTRVNGAPVDEVAIGFGDEILLGDTRLIVDAPGG